MKKIALPSILFTLVLLAFTSYLALAVAPTEQTMGNVQRIFYYHVPSAWVAGVCFFINFLASVAYFAKRKSDSLSDIFLGPVIIILLALIARLVKRESNADALAAASAEVGVVFCTVVLITGPIWARPVWGIWWTWDARLTTTLVLWLIYVSYLVLRRFSAGGQTQVMAAAFAIFGFADVPIVYMSIRWFRTQHPSPVMGGGANSGLDPAMLHVFLINLAAFTVLGMLFVWLRYRLQMQEQALESAHAQLALKGIAQ
jgi:heme exporter protein C